MRAASLARRLFELTGVALGPLLIVWCLAPSRALAIAALLVVALHAGYGLTVIARAHPNNGSYGGLRNWTFLLERATGALLIGYLAFYLWTTRPTLSLSPALLHARYFGIEALWLHLLGLAMLAFHFCNGAIGAAIHNGLLVSRRAQRSAGAVAALVAIALFAAAATPLFALYRSGR
ncbi:MAG: hypothetical protein ACHQ17_00865 [Polyangia bacterium]|jgi:succinate dehydrogenase / fumarate reductase cytochrome b subunit